MSALLAEVLVRAGMSVVHAQDGEEARIRVREPGLAAVVCDLDMPRASGLEVLESMADLPFVPPAIVVSGYLDDSIAARLAKLAWVREVMRKPFDLLAFARRVRELATAPEDVATNSSF
ncbi:MAG: response regulator [Planctomycetes bacterium]|nr:response regulator [Planctomycetota bacterium]